MDDMQYDHSSISVNLYQHAFINEINKITSVWRVINDEAQHY